MLSNGGEGVILPEEKVNIRYTNNDMRYLSTSSKGKKEQYV